MDLINLLRLLRLLRLIRKMYSIFQTKSVFKQIIWTEQSTVLLVEFTFVFDDLLLLVFFLFYSTLSLFVYLIKFPMNNSGSYGMEHLVEWYVEMVQHDKENTGDWRGHKANWNYLKSVLLWNVCLHFSRVIWAGRIMSWFTEIIRERAVIAAWYLK